MGQVPQVICYPMGKLSYGTGTTSYSADIHSDIYSTELRVYCLYENKKSCITHRVTCRLYVIGIWKAW